MNHRIFLITALFILMIPAKSQANNIISIRGNADTSKFLPLINFLTQELGIQDVNIMISFSNRLKDGLNGYIKYEADSSLGTRNALIYINAKTHPSVQMVSICHEMIHLQQYVSGRLEKKTGGVFRWDSEIYSHLRPQDYRSRPWEVDAFSREKALYKKYQDYLAAPVM